MKNKILLFIISFFFLVSFFSCKDNINSNIDTVIIPSSNVSYAKYIQPIFTIKCNYSGCHNSSDQAGGVSLASWSNVNTPPVVLPGDTTTSHLIWAIEGKSGAYPMPPVGYAPLTANQIMGIKVWVKEGALNN
jgi:hypothetical protein